MTATLSLRTEDRAGPVGYPHGAGFGLSLFGIGLFGIGLFSYLASIDDRYTMQGSDLLPSRSRQGRRVAEKSQSP